jgi:CubicO group peptidase (beta-lactamase class C family)
MTARVLSLALAALLFAGLAEAQPPATPATAAATPWVVPSDPEIRTILTQRIDTLHQGVGIVVGVVDAHGRRIIAYGHRAKGDTRPLDGDTVFEIGSMTKVFTSLLLSDMVRKGEVALDDPVGKFLPASVHMPERGGKQVTLVDLATHSSGLSPLPSNMPMTNPNNPYADYTVDQLYAYLNGAALTHDIGTHYEYSNMAVGLLGHALARRAGGDYETVVRQRITGPLGMKDTAITLTPALTARMAQGHSATLEPVSNWDLPTFAGAGALRSTTNDVLTFLAANMGLRPSPLKPAMDAQLAVRRPTTIPNTQVALGWHIATSPQGEVVWHNGGTGGFRTFMAYSPDRKVGVVVLTNAATPAGGDDIGFHVLTGRPLAKLPAQIERTAIALPAAQLAGLVGRYQFAPQAFLTVTLEGDQLSAALTGQGPAKIFPESADEFFYRVVNAQLSFRRGPDGRATGLVLHQNGRDSSALRADP